MKPLRVLSLFDGISTGQYVLEKLGIPVEVYYASEIEQSTIDITMFHYPKTVQLGDVTQIDFKQFEGKIDLLIGGSPCFVAGTLVMTDKGMKPIEDIQEGDMVLTHKSRYRKVLKIGSRLVDEVVRLKGMGIHELITTKSHPFYIRNLYKVYSVVHKAYLRCFTEPEWIPVEDFELKKAYFGSTFAAEQTEESDKDELFWYFVGRFVGDGWTYKTKRKHRKNSYIYKVMLCCSKSEYDEVKSLMDKLGYNYCVANERTVYKFCITRQELHEFLVKCGHGAANKRVHPDLWKLDVKYKKAFLEGYLSADGHYEKSRNVWHCSTISKTLMYELKILIQEVYHSAMSLWCYNQRDTAIIEDRLVKINPCYSCSFYIDNTVRKQNKAFYENSYVWSPIKLAENIKEETIVYNLEVDEDNSYTANSIVVHNCQSLSISTSKKRQNLDGKSKLFFDYVRALNDVKPKYFFLENVASMNNESKQIMSQYMGCNPQFIDSSIFSAQERKRLYWFNWGKLHKDLVGNKTYSVPVPVEREPLVIKDILEENPDEKYYYTQTFDFHGLDKSVCATLHINGHDILKRVHSPYAKCHTLTCCRGGNLQKKVYDEKRNQCRKLTPLEYERLQGLPDDYTKYGIGGKLMSTTARYNAVGNGWEANTICHLFGGLKEELEHECIELI